MHLKKYICLMTGLSLSMNIKKISALTARSMQLNVVAHLNLPKKIKFT